MTIRRSFKDVSVISYNGEKDSFGQIRQDSGTARTVPMAVKLYSQSNVQDPRYVEVTDIGLTYDKNITAANRIAFDDSTYNVLFTIPSGRITQVFMKRC